MPAIISSLRCPTVDWTSFANGRGEMNPLPQNSAEQFGKDLGLPESPIYALFHLSGGKPCALILDQLDALRWTSPHSGTALNVCKEMISQTETVNKHMGGKLSIVFASRTFDLEQDSGLQSLFATTCERKNENALTWRKIQVNPFDEEEVVRVTGSGSVVCPRRASTPKISCFESVLWGNQPISALFQHDQSLTDPFPD